VRQDRRADEARVADPAIAEGVGQAVDHDASPASAGDLDLGSNAAASPKVANGKNIAAR
jgi:hypothetical protein